MKRKDSKEDLGLAEEHIKLAEGLIEETAQDSDGGKAKVLTNVAFSLEKAEAELEELDESELKELD